MQANWRPGWEAGMKMPSFTTSRGMVTNQRQQYLIGNTPAIDILNIEKNEGIYLSENPKLLFAGELLCA